MCGVIRGKPRVKYDEKIRENVGCGCYGKMKMLAQDRSARRDALDIYQCLL